MLQYVKSFGGAKFFDSNWDEKNFNIEELFEKEPYDAVLFLLKHLILRCPHPQNKSQETVCLKSITHNFISLTKIDDIVEVFKNLKIDENMIRKTYQNGQSFSIDQVRRIECLLFKKLYQ